MKSTVSIFSQRELLTWAPGSTIDSIQHYMKVVVLEVGDVLFHEGDYDETFYILLDGQLKAESQNWELNNAEILPDRTLGEAAILTGRPYVATVTATKDSKLLSITRRAFYRMIKRHPEVQTYFKEVITPRIHSSYLTEILNQLFGDLGATLEQQIQAHVSWKHLDSGEMLFEEGTPGDDLIIVVTGRLQVYTMRDGDEQTIANIHQGEMVGEMALLTDEPRSASIRATRESHIVRLNRADFQTLVEEHPQALMKITQTIISRQKSSRRHNTKTKQGSQNFAVIFLDDNNLALIDSLAENSTQSGLGRVLNADRFDTYYGQTDAAQTGFGNYLHLIITRWMTELEIRHEHLYWVGDVTWTNWTIRCLRNADRLLLVVNSEGSPALRDIERKIAEHFPTLRQDLILLHPAETAQPTGTARWLDQRNVATHHHVRRDSVNHITRVARHLAKQTIGLSLSGGGATALAHIGAFQALEDQSIPVDMISGTSMGAIIGAGVALGKSAAEMSALASQLANKKQIFDLTIPFVALMKSEKVTQLFKDLYGNVQIEDLWIPFFCTSSNLTQSTVSVHDRGALWKAIRVTTSMPVVSVPVNIDNEMHIDGAVMNNFPVDVMYDRIDGGQIIGIMVSPTTVKEDNIEDLTESISGWRLLWQRLNPFARQSKVPPIMTTLFRALQVNSQYHFQSVQHLADLAIVMKDNTYKFYELDKQAEIIALGYRTASPLIAAWWQAQHPAKTIDTNDIVKATDNIFNISV